MRIKKFSGALLISFVFHFIVVFIIGIRLVNQEQQQFNNLVGVEMCLAPEPPKAKLRKPIVKLVTNHSFTDSPNESRAITLLIPVPEMVTQANLPISNNPSSLTFSVPALQQAAVISDLSNIKPVKGEKLLSTEYKSIENIGVVHHALGSVADYIIILGNVEVPPIPEKLNPPNGATFDDVFYKNPGQTHLLIQKTTISLHLGWM